MLAKLGHHGINAEKGQIWFYLDKKIISYSRHCVAMDRQRITEVEDKYEECRQKSLIYLPAFCLEQVDKVKDKENQRAYFIGIFKIKCCPDKII
jgi:hypothetical protein